MCGASEINSSSYWEFSKSTFIVNSGFISQPGTSTILLVHVYNAHSIFESSNNGQNCASRFYAMTLLELRQDLWRQKTIESPSYRVIALPYIQPFWYNTALWLVDRQMQGSASITSIHMNVILLFSARLWHSAICSLFIPSPLSERIIDTAHSLVML